MSASGTETVRAYAELFRISNLPTVVSNTAVGVALGCAGADIPLEAAGPCAIAILFLYLAGVASNDAIDADWDATERPERPIPSGRLSLAQAYRAALSAFGLGLAVLASIGFTALAVGVVLVAVITLYNMFHKRFAASIVFVGAARGLVYLTAATAVGGALDAPKPMWFMVTIAMYTIIFTLVARSEHKDRIDGGRWLAAGIPLIVLIPGVWITVNEALVAVGISVVLILWQARAVLKVFRIPPETKDAVHIWLSGFCLMDAFYLGVLGYSGLIAVPVVCFLLTLLLQRRIMGT
jgi:4-hydroxybenzoate polyprenyltransferase